MIGIVILGLGMTMVAIMFPVAWDRARRLNDFTIERTATAAAHATIKSLVPGTNYRVLDGNLTVTTAGFAGDLIFSPPNGTIIAKNPQWPSDNWVHALNMQNVQVENRRFVSENPWLLEHATDLNDSKWADDVTDPLLANSYLTSRIDFHQRIYPPMDRRLDVDPVTGAFTKPDTRWDETLDTRRFFWAVLHRLSVPVGPTFLNPSNEHVALADEAKGQSRSFDLYYVLLRRARSTLRYARQDPTFSATPDPYDLTAPAVTPKPLGPEFDVMFPIAWRAQVEFPKGTALAPTRADIVGIPTEVTVPPTGITGEAGRLSVQLFPAGTRFIDEVTGEIFRVVQRRVIATDEDQALLTLDREVTAEELTVVDDPRCGGTCFHRVRTVWVFPPPVEPRGSVGDPLIFTGPSPVIEITIRTLNAAPTS